MRFKILVLLPILICIICNSADAQIQHLWKDIHYVGVHAGLYNVDDERDGYNGGFMVFYHSQLEHQHPSIWGSHISDWGILGSANYFLQPESDLSLALQFYMRLVVRQNRPPTTFCGTILVGKEFVGRDINIITQLPI